MDVGKIERINQLAQRIESAEHKTTGEIVVALVHQSDPYPGARWRLAVFFALAAEAALSFVLDAWPFWVWGVAQIALIGVGHLLGMIPPLLRLFMTPQEITREVHERAVRAFLEVNLHTTPARNGVLIFLSLREHSLEILADIGIHQKVAPGTWETIVKKTTLALKRGDATEVALLGAIEDCEAELIRHFPETDASTTNHLANHVCWLK